MVQRGEILAGNAREALDDLSGEACADPTLAGRSMALFATFERELAESGAAEVSDPGALDALRALGYAR
jgi:hypothetical protein